MVLGKTFTSLRFSSHLEQNANDAETCVTRWCQEEFVQGWCLPRGTTWRDKAMGTVEGPGCFVLTSREHGGHVPGREGFVPL